MNSQCGSNPQFTYPDLVEIDLHHDLLQGKHTCVDGTGPSEQEQEDSKPQRLSLFQDEQLNSFFRRLAWSPDGMPVYSEIHLYLMLCGAKSGVLSQ